MLARTATESSCSAGLVGFGGAGTACDQTFGLVRYNNGVPDTGFGGDNRVVTCLRGDRAQAHAVVVQSTGQIVAVGRTNGPNGDCKINPGISITDFDNRADGEGGSELSFDEALAAAIQANGRIVAAGTSNAPIEVDNTNFAVTRYTRDGVAITDFGTNNRVLTDVTNTSGKHVTNSSTDRANAIAIQLDGLIVVVGGTPKFPKRLPELFR